MTPVKSSPLTRRQKAAATRERMLQAAIEVFAERGYVGARMADIATRAGVAVQTLYFTFHTKPELLQACYDYAVLGPDRLPPPEQPFFAATLTARSGRSSLRAFVAGNAEILARVATTDEVAKAALHEPEVASVVERSEDLRRLGYGQVVATLAERFSLRSGLDAETATDLLLMYAGSATYLTLTRYGWSRERYEAWLTDTLARQLLARPGR
ncbi:TetR/AcrR family transcriptional regulator [Nocardioides limicola]|uniref:TetR/AcrR family transcriptional regulator n=1 Tax=Nocardioides limicola TaxID=2803368 RepID=UPI00193BECB9|nr:TetR/AcrR family transcriptional regulator [Nocardioides sp. DJM-14]